MRLKATNDYLIERLIQDPNYVIKDTGEALTRIGVNGKVSNVWRDCVIEKCTGYKAVQYQRKKLNLHRIVFRKFVGELKENITICHIDGNISNNHSYNLEVFTKR